MAITNAKAYHMTYTINDARREGYAKLPGFSEGYEDGLALSRFKDFIDQYVQQAYDRGYEAGLSAQRHTERELRAEFHGVA